MYLIFIQMDVFKIKVLNLFVCLSVRDKESKIIPHPHGVIPGEITHQKNKLYELKKDSYFENSKFILH